MLEYLTNYDLQEFIKYLVDVIGIEFLENLVKFTRGSSLYISNENSIIRFARNQVQYKKIVEV